jgi:hypothetical protein
LLTFLEKLFWFPLVQLSMALLDRVLHVDTEKMQITVEAGVRVSTVLDVLREHGMTLENLASINDQQIGGFVQVRNVAFFLELIRGRAIVRAKMMTQVYLHELDLIRVIAGECARHWSHHPSSGLSSSFI